MNKIYSIQKHILLLLFVKTVQQHRWCQIQCNRRYFLNISKSYLISYSRARRASLHSQNDEPCPLSIWYIPLAAAFSGDVTETWRRRAASNKWSPWLSLTFNQFHIKFLIGDFVFGRDGSTVFVYNFPMQIFIVWYCLK